jgi:predicted secreted protein
MARERHDRRGPAVQSSSARRAMRETHGAHIDGPVVGRGSAGGRPGSGAAGRFILRLVVLGAVVFGGYWALNTFSGEILARAPFVYPYFRALGFEVQEPAGYGLRIVTLPRVVREIDARGQQTILLVRGSIVNDTKERRAVPRLRIVVSGSRGASVSWTYEPPPTTIEPGAQIGFQTRFQHGQVVLDPAARVTFEKR